MARKSRMFHLQSRAPGRKTWRFVKEAASAEALSWDFEQFLTPDGYSVRIVGPNKRVVAIATPKEG